MRARLRTRCPARRCGSRLRRARCWLAARLSARPPARDRCRRRLRVRPVRLRAPARRLRTSRRQRQPPHAATARQRSVPQLRRMPLDRSGAPFATGNFPGRCSARLKSALETPGAGRISGGSERPRWSPADLDERTAPALGGGAGISGRKVRAPQDRMPVNGWWGRPRGKCHRKQTAPPPQGRGVRVKR